MSFSCTQREFDEWASVIYHKGNSGWMLKGRQDSLQQKTSWLEGVASVKSQSLAVDCWITFYIVYDTFYSQPQLCFSTTTVLDAPILSRLFPDLHFLHSAPGEDGPKTVPLVSYCFCEELSLSAWRIHSCDTGKLLANAVLDGRIGNLLELFITAISPFLIFPPALCVS
ncbi:hypothetical protein STCU_00968 [Strigomonas culicis]|uniref:Uncharacterized protein n=1 Tax=Strigomonas culicis TaxID=28005 RepID=S9W8Y4_9TRYP|nr:hypothetical protein STCU_00968 [Strigomonas culicis]|eukprot:EPY35706.1 hypothetical protein STCU_00968 [Strigomonas culicis]